MNFEQNNNWSIISPVPEDHTKIPDVAHEKRNGKYVDFPYTHKWFYRDQQNNLLGLVVRYETEKGKQTPPLAYVVNDKGKHSWKRKAWWQDGKRPLYDLDKLAHSPNAQVIIVEGEKCAETLQAYIEENGFPDRLVAVTWPGGTNAVDKVDWSPLKSFDKIVIWPDADTPGSEASKKIAEILQRL